MLKSGETDIEQFKEKTAFEKKARLEDPTSEESISARALLKQQGVNVPDTVSAAFIEKNYPQFANIIEKDRQAKQRAIDKEEQREFRLEERASSWLNDRTVGASFTSEYIPYTNVFKKLGEIAKSVGEDSTIVQQLFKTDGEGNPVLENGKLQYNDVMAETLLKVKIRIRY